MTRTDVRLVRCPLLTVAQQFDLVIFFADIMECDVYYCVHDFIHDFEILLMIVFQKRIQIVSKLVEVCTLCKEKEGSVTLRPCDHKFCTGIVTSNINN